MALAGASYGLLDVPKDAKCERSMQTRCLLRYIFLQQSEDALQYYVDIALKHLTAEVKGIEPDLLAVFLEQNQSSIVHRQLFVILSVINATSSFYDFILKHSQDERDNVVHFAEVLQTHFFCFLSKTKDDGSPASNPDDVMYPTLDHFVNSITIFYLQQ